MAELLLLLLLLLLPSWGGSAGVDDKVVAKGDLLKGLLVCVCRWEESALRWGTAVGHEMLLPA
jgi:hypothetical protein